MGVKRFQYYLYWFIPILICFLYELLFSEFKADRFSNFSENVLFTLAIILFISLFKRKRIQLFLNYFLYVGALISLFLETTFYKIFSTSFNPSAIFIALETNTAEAKEFLKFYIDFSIIVLLVLLVVVALLFFKNLKKVYQPFFLKVSGRIIVSFVLILLLITLKITKLIVPNFPYLVIRATIMYFEDQQKINNLEIDEREGNFKEVKFVGNSNENQTYVLVIGESLNRNYMQLYGYERNTNPLLKNIEDELLIYKDVVSSHSQTIRSLREVFSLYNFKRESESTLIQLGNQAGFKTFWISNQRPVGKYDSFVTHIARAADQKIFLNTTINGSVAPYDEVVLEPIEKVLKDSVSKKLIVVHLMGTHVDYSDRYPERFSKFKGKSSSRFTTEIAYLRKNEYANAVYYNDSIVHEIIKLVKRQNESSYVLYFADHGDEVYDNKPFAGHFDYNTTKAMFEIPFILWQSEKFQKDKSISEETIKPYVIDDFIHAFSDLSQIEFSELDLSKSIFSEKFKPKKRIIGEAKDYDLWKLENE